MRYKNRGSTPLEKFKLFNRKHNYLMGFTLIEVLFVTVILGILTTLAIPQFLRSKMQANESAAIGSLKTLSTAMQSYSTSQTPNGFAGASLAVLTAPAGGPPYIDELLGNGSKQGYNFNLIVTGPYVYTCQATPQVVGSTGIRVFRVTESGTVEVQNGGIWQAID
ncbi:type II secretion system protein [Candidatus Omnitrophota bacterium]